MRIIDVGQARIPSILGPIDNGDPNLIAPNIRTDKPMFGLAGTMPVRSGDTASLSSSIAGTILKLLASDGYRNGSSDNVTITDANFIAANIPYNISMFGLAGTGVNAKYYANGTATSSASTMAFTPDAGGTGTTAGLNVTGLNFPNGIGIIRIGDGTANNNVFFDHNLLTPNSKIFYNSGYWQLLGNAFVTTTSFQMPVNGTSKSYSWEAWGL